MSVELDALVCIKLIVRHSKLLDAMRFGHSCLAGRCPPETLYYLHERLVEYIIADPAVSLEDFIL